MVVHANPEIKVAPNLCAEIIESYRALQPGQMKQVAKLGLGEEYASLRLPVDLMTNARPIDAFVPAGPLAPGNQTKVISQADTFYVVTEPVSPGQSQLVRGPFPISQDYVGPS